MYVYSHYRGMILLLSLYLVEKLCNYFANMILYRQHRLSFKIISVFMGDVSIYGQENRLR